MQTDSGLDELRGTPLIVFSPAELNYDDILLSQTSEDALEQSTEPMPGAGLHEARQCIARSTHHVRAEPVAIGRFQFYHRTAAGCLQPHMVRGLDDFRSTVGQPLGACNHTWCKAQLASSSSSCSLIGGCQTQPTQSSATI